jgi:pheromone shutdown protein TraB
MHFNPVMPGLEVKFAIEEANKAGSKVIFLGYEVDDNTVTRLYNDNRNTIFTTLWNFMKLNKKYIRELTNNNQTISQHGIKKFIESNCDRFTMNW